MTNKILLVDRADRQFTDLITFKTVINEDYIRYIIGKYGEEHPEYTNEDIYELLDKEYGIISIEFLNYPYIEY